MSNFTKSIVYSAAVLAVGLIAIFAIYNNMAGQPGMSGIEPAAGEQTFGETADSAMDNAADALSETGEAIEEGTTDAAEGVIAGEATDSAVEAVEAEQGELTPEQKQAAEAAAETAAKQSAEGASEDAEEAAKAAAEEAVEGTEPAAGTTTPAPAEEPAEEPAQ